MSNLTPPVLIFKDGPQAGQQVNLNQPELIIGRETGVDLVINTPLVSRRHCRIFRQDEHYFIEDLGSSNGTFLNGKRLQTSSPLADGDQVGLSGEVHFAFTLPADLYQTAMLDSVNTLIEAPLPAQAATVEGLGLPAAELSRPPQLSVSIAGGLTATYSLTAEAYRLGRAQGNEIVIDSPIVSGTHAVLEKKSTPSTGSAVYSLRVLPEAANPFYYRGQTLSEALTLHDGDLLRIGSLDPEKRVTLIYHNPAILFFISRKS